MLNVGIFMESFLCNSGIRPIFILKMLQGLNANENNLDENNKTLTGKIYQQNRH